MKLDNKYQIDWHQYAQIAREAAAEGIVLLKNERNALPVKTGETLSVFGRIQFDYYKSGTGSGGMVNAKYVVGILDALKEENDICLNEQLEKIYRKWLETHPFDMGAGWAQEPWSQQEMPLEESILAEAAANSDAALVVIGRTAGEDRDAKNEAGSFLLTEDEERMLQLVCETFERVIVVLNVGNIIDMKWVERYQPSAVLYTWQGGMEGGHAVADVLLGRVNPCGKLTDTIAYDITQYPSANDFGGEYGNCYTEDIYVGYRYFETFAKGDVLYPFGYGLSYTSFDVTCIKIEYQEEEKKTIIQVRIVNTGTFSGKEVVQVYVNPPQGTLGKPLRSLVAFAKTNCLEPREAQTLVLEVADEMLASYDDGGLTGHKSCYVLEEGSYEFYVGTDVRSASFAGSIDKKQLEIVKQCTEALAPIEKFQRIHPQVIQETEKKQSVNIVWEDVMQRTYRVTDRIANDNPEEIVYTGDKGYRLKDVYDGLCSMETFIAQLSDNDLCCIVRGEGMNSPKVTPGTAAAFGGVTDSLKQFGIPCACCSDGPSGIRMDCGTYAFSLPNGTCLACTWNEALVEQLYIMEGAELRKNRIDTLLGPGMNIHRHPLNGRNFEYFSEDPFITGKIAAAQLKGMHTYGVTGTIKHFAGNNQEYHRRQYNSIASERALREIYLKGFEIAVKEGNAHSIMTTYGAINGLWTATNYDLLTVILHGEWNYDGVVMTDWWADLNEEGQPASIKNTAAMVRCQNDLYMVTANAQQNSNHDNLEESLAAGTVKRAQLQRSAKNILQMIMRSPVMDRSLNRISKEEQEAYELMEDQDKVNFDLEYYCMDESLELVDKIPNTNRGTSVVIGIQIKTPGVYFFHLKAKVDASLLAQVPVTISMNGNVSGVITLNGTNGEWIEVDQNLEVLRNPNNLLKLYFAQSGMQIASAKVSLVQKIEDVEETN